MGMEGIDGIHSPDHWLAVSGRTNHGKLPAVGDWAWTSGYGRCQLNVACFPGFMRGQLHDGFDDASRQRQTTSSRICTIRIHKHVR